MKLTKSQLIDAINTIYSALSEGEGDKEIATKMGITNEEYGRLKIAMLDARADAVRGEPTEHTYVRYTIDMIQNIRDLTAMIKEFKSTKQYTAMVGAIRARADIQDRIIKTGQDFGLVAREPTRKEIVAGVMVADLSNVELKRAITAELADLNDLMRQYGDKDISKLKAGAIHRGPALPPAELIVEEDDTSALPPPPKKKRKAKAKAKRPKIKVSS